MNRVDVINKLKELGGQELRVIDASIPKLDYITLDLSKGNLALKDVDLTSAEETEAFIKRHTLAQDGRVAFGGYLEVRNIYNRSEYFQGYEDPKDKRNIHLGIDFWCEAGTAVLAILEGEVHSFNNNTNHGDYGPTVLLKHTFDDVVFYTLYGHLSMASIAELELGQQVARGQKIGEFGDAAVNGDYAPHLHFQIILDVQKNFGDYPGVCSENDLDFYLDNCPDPELLVRLLIKR
jgi:murein DD-endopeptidase MepM/ murein hydrolase activator NlpD